MSKKFALTAIIYDKKGKVLSIGQNSYIKTHPLQAKHAKKMGEPMKVYPHAEINAIIRCKDISKAHKIVVTRFHSNGKPANAKPCKICMSAIAKTNIKYVEHS